MIAATCDDARSRSSFTTTWSNQPALRPSPRPAVSRRLAIRSSDSVPRPRRRRSSSSIDGGSRKIRTASGTCVPDLLGPLDVDLQDDVVARRQLLLDGPPRACRTDAHERRPLEELVRRRSSVELVLVDEEVVDAVDLVRPRGRGW